MLGNSVHLLEDLLGQNKAPSRLILKTGVQLDDTLWAQLLLSLHASSIRSPSTNGFDQLIVMLATKISKSNRTALISFCLNNLILLINQFQQLESNAIGTSLEKNQIYLAINEIASPMIANVVGLGRTTIELGLCNQACEIFEQFFDTSTKEFIQLYTNKSNAELKSMLKMMQSFECPQFSSISTADKYLEDTSNWSMFDFQSDIHFSI